MCVFVCVRVQLTVRLELKEWQFSDGSRAVANHLPGTITLNSVPSLHPYTGRKLRISAVEGRNLAPMSAGSSINPYLKLFYAKVKLEVLFFLFIASIKSIWHLLERGIRVGWVFSH